MLVVQQLAEFADLRSRVFRTAQELCRAQRHFLWVIQGETSIRRILGVFSLLKKYRTAAVEDACATALDIGVHEYRFVRRYLERRPHPHLCLRQIDPLIRQLTEYRDFINLKIQETTE